MIVEIEFYKGDIFLTGKPISYQEFLRQLCEIQMVYDRIQDNFVALLCRRYGWTITDSSKKATYVYDRDVEKAYRVKGREIF